MRRKVINPKLTLRIQEIIGRHKYSWAQKLYLSPLFGLSKVYLGIGKYRSFAYRHGLLPKKKLPCRVICVGNVTVGGTGKTPIVELVCKTLIERGEKVGIISRGYGGNRQSGPGLISDSQVLIVSDGKNILASVKEAGDEPVMLAVRLPGVPVLTAKSRYKAGCEAMERFNLQALVMDDGFQHLQLARDIDIIVLDGQDPFGNGYGLPAGKLRESPKAIKRADLIILTKIEDNRQKDQVISKIRRYNQTAPVITGCHKPRDLISLGDDEIIPIETLKGKSVLAFSGIGDPSYFLTTLRKLGAHVSNHLVFPDHHWYTKGEIQEIEQKVLSLNLWGAVTTEKDAVRLSHSSQCPIRVLRLDMALVDGQRAFKQILYSGF